MPQSPRLFDLNFAWDQILGIIRDPYANPTGSMLLLAASIVALLIFASIIASVVIVVTSRQRRARELEEIKALQDYLAVVDPGAAAAAAAAHPSEHVVAPRERPSALVWVTWIVVLLLAPLVLVVAVGAVTASSATCEVCHAGTVHTKAVKSGVADAHSSVTCVSCHESSGWLGSATIEVPERVAHFVSGLRAPGVPSQYGDVASSSCYRCHGSVGSKTTLDGTLGVKMAHRQPLDAGAQCLDCHTAATGVISTATSGMSPCLRCHDGKKASAECSLCHVKDVSVATRPSVNRVEMAGRTLIATPDCGSCHDMAKTCDPCHGGVRMPHSPLFKSWGHARKGVEDIWNNNGKACAKCHYATRRPCTKCHTFFPGHPSPVWKTVHQSSARRSCDGCHNSRQWVAGRDFCALCHGKVRVTQ